MLVYDQLLNFKQFCSLISEEEILLRDSVKERTESRAMEHEGACLIEDLNRVPLIYTVLTLKISTKALYRPSKKLFSLLRPGGRIPD